MEQEQREEINSMLSRMIRDFNQENLRQEEVAAKADPLAHKLTKVMDNTRYRYWDAGKDGLGRRVMFCYSTHKNAAGFYLGWREVRSKNGAGKRDMWLSRRVRKRVMEIAERRMIAFRRKRAELALP